MFGDRARYGNRNKTTYPTNVGLLTRTASEAGSVCSSRHILWSGPMTTACLTDPRTSRNSFSSRLLTTSGSTGLPSRSVKRMVLLLTRL